MKQGIWILGSFPALLSPFPLSFLSRQRNKLRAVSCISGDSSFFSAGIPANFTLSSTSCPFFLLRSLHPSHKDFLSLLTIERGFWAGSVFAFTLLPMTSGFLLCSSSKLPQQQH
jgi:hypothetical protein